MSTYQLPNKRGAGIDIDSADPTIPAVRVRGAGDLLRLRNASGTEVLTVTQTGALLGREGGTMSPQAHSLAAWAFDPATVTSGLALTAGTLYLVKMQAAVAASATKIYWHVTSSGATPTSSQNFVGLYSSAGTLLGSAGADSDYTSGFKTSTITATAVAAGSFYWAAFLFNGATPPTLGRAGNVTTGASLVNVGLSAAQYRFATAGTSQTALPASITPASNTASAFALWAAIGA